MAQGLNELNAGDAFIVVPSDTVALPKTAVSLIACGAGNIVVVTWETYQKGIKAGIAVGSMATVTIVCIAGLVIPLKVSVVKTASTVTAGNILALTVS